MDELVIQQGLDLSSDNRRIACSLEKELRVRVAGLSESRSRGREASSRFFLFWRDGI